jgi:hypothetical protein
MTLILRRATNRAQIFHLRKNGLTQRNSLTVAELAALGASNNSTSAFQQNAARTFRSELVADLIAIIDYTDAYGGKSVRAVSGVDAAAIDAEIWLPDWLTPVDVDSPIKLVNIEPGRLSAISVVDPDNEYRSAVAIAIPGITGSARLILALSTQPVDFDDSQIASAKIIASLLSLSASRSNALRLAQRGESQLAASRQITRSGSNSTGSSDTGNAKSPLAKISDQLRQFIEFDVLVIRVVEDDKFTTLESLGTAGDKPYVIAT